MKAAAPPPKSLAPHHLRFFALIFDYLVIVILLRLVDELTLGEHWDLNPGVWEMQYFSPLWYLGLPLLLLGKDGFSGRSPGKWVTGIAIAQATDPSRFAGYPATLLRNLCLVLLPLEAVLIFFDPYLRRLGDRLAGTVVVADPRAPNLARRWLVVAMFFFSMLLASFLISPWNMRRSAAFQTAQRIAQEDPGLAEAVGTPFTLDDTPLFELPKNMEREPAKITFEATGPRGTRKVAVVMRLRRAAGVWEREAVRVAPNPAAPAAPTRDAPILETPAKGK